MLKIFDDLYQFSSYASPIDLTFHQYLLNRDEPILIHTGNTKQAAQLVPQIKEVIRGKKLKYIFISHFESDECGGLSVILKEFPRAKSICSDVTARQLEGFGIIGDAIVKKPGDKMIIDDMEFEFISYPSEMHLWEGLLFIENTRKILFSSDLMIRFGNVSGKILENTLEKEIERITEEQIPDKERRELLKAELGKLDIKFIATGHGQCIKINKDI